MKKTIIRWVVVLLALYIIGHIFFDFGETRLMRIITGLIGSAFFVSILIYLNMRSEDKK